MIECCNVCKSFGLVSVLNNISFNVSRTNVLAIVGPSGSGKTTLARILGGLEFHDSGVVCIDGIILSLETVKSFRHNVGFVFQLFALFSHMTVLQNVCYAPINVYGLPRDRVEKEARKMLTRFSMGDCCDLYPSVLSGGQQQRVAIVRAMILHPKTIILDEPTASLDPELVSEVVDMIKQLRLSETSVVIVTHDLFVAKAVSDHMMFLFEGSVLDFDKTDNFFVDNSARSEGFRRFLGKFITK